MSDTQRLGALGALVLLFLILMGSTYTLGQSEQALILQFGKIVRPVKEPGLHFKIPLVQEVRTFDRRLLDYDAAPRELITKDSERIVVDAFVRYRIVNPVQYYVAVRNEETMNSRLSAILESSVRQVISSVPLSTVLSEGRGKVMGQIRDEVNAQVRGTDQEGGLTPKGGFGIEIVDVRIMRSDLPQENSEAVYARMRSEREREAREFVAQGTEQALRIQADADRERVVTLAEARKKAAILRGEGDADAARIYNTAIGTDPAFFEQWRSLQAYKETLKAGNTTMVLSPGSGFLKSFDKDAAK